MPKPRSPYTSLEHAETYVREHIAPNANAGYSPLSFDLILELITYEMINGSTVGDQDKHTYRVHRYIADCGDELVDAACLTCGEKQHTRFAAGPHGWCNRHSANQVDDHHPIPLHIMLRVKVVEHAYALWQSSHQRVKEGK